MLYTMKQRENGYFRQRSKYFICTLRERRKMSAKREISKLTGISRQTINSAVRRLEKRTSYICWSRGKAEIPFFA